MINQFSERSHYRALLKVWSRMAKDRKQYIILTPKTDKGRQRMGNNGEKWVFRGMTNMKFVRIGVPVLRAMSRDGNVVLCIQEKSDPDFDWRYL